MLFKILSVYLLFRINTIDINHYFLTLEFNKLFMVKINVKKLENFKIKATFIQKQKMLHILTPFFFYE